VASFEEFAPDGREMGQRVEWTLRTHPFLVAEVDGAIVGYAYAGPHHHTRAAYRWATDVTVYIDAAARRQGVGTALYGRLFQILRAQNLVIACAGITLPNDGSVALHEAQGFRPVGVYSPIGFKAGAWHDVGWWQLELAPPGEPPAEPIAFPDLEPSA
jgi:L-amino acid N-acyltransferase YncA